MKGFTDLIKRNPQRLAAVFKAGLAVAVGFGLGLTGEQVALLVVFMETVLLLPSEAAVTPVASPRLSEGTTVTVTTPAGEPDTEVTL